MPSWRQTASEQAQEDLDKLVNVCLEFAQGQLGKRAGFLPYGAAIQANGDIKLAMADRDSEEASSDASRALSVIFTAQAGERRIWA
jgi:hypothetical protein